MFAGSSITCGRWIGGKDPEMKRCGGVRFERKKKMATIELKREKDFSSVTEELTIIQTLSACFSAPKNVLIKPVGKKKIHISNSYEWKNLQ